MRADLRNSQMLSVIAFNVSQKKKIHHVANVFFIIPLSSGNIPLAHAVERFNVASIYFESRKIHRIETQIRASLKVLNGSGLLRKTFVMKKLSKRYLDSQESSWRAKSFFKVPRSNLSRSRMLF